MILSDDRDLPMGWQSHDLVSNKFPTSTFGQSCSDRPLSSIVQCLEGLQGSQLEDIRLCFDLPESTSPRCKVINHEWDDTMSGDN
jgi:hypothetical protein